MICCYNFIIEGEKGDNMFKKQIFYSLIFFIFFLSLQSKAHGNWWTDLFKKKSAPVQSNSVSNFPGTSLPQSVEKSTAPAALDQKELVNANGAPNLLTPEKCSFDKPDSESGSSIYSSVSLDTKLAVLYLDGTNKSDRTSSVNILLNNLIELQDITAKLTIYDRDKPSQSGRGASNFEGPHSCPESALLVYQVKDLKTNTYFPFQNIAMKKGSPEWNNNDCGYTFEFANVILKKIYQQIAPNPFPSIKISGEMCVSNENHSWAQTFNLNIFGSQDAHQVTFHPINEAWDDFR